MHAGFGIYNALLDDLSYRLDQNAPFNSTISLKNVSLSSLNLVPGAPLPTGGTISPAGVQPDVYTPTVLSYTFKVEQKLTADTSLSAGYVGSHGYHEILSVDANEPFPTYRNGAPFYAKGSPLANPNLANSTTWLSEGVSSYNALQVDLNHRFARGFQLRGVYTYSKSLDDGGTLATAVGANAPAFVMYPGNTKLDYGLSTFDVRNLAVLNGTYQLPFGKGRQNWMNRAIGGWSVASVLTLQSGFPFTPQLGFNPTNNGDSRNPIRPSWNPAFSGPVILGNPDAILQSGRLHGARQRHLRKCWTGCVNGTGFGNARLLRHQRFGAFRKIEAAVPVGVFQYPEPHELLDSESSRVHIRWIRTVQHGRRDQRYFHNLTPDPVWTEAALVVNR